MPLAVWVQNTVVIGNDPKHLLLMNLGVRISSFAPADMIERERPWGHVGKCVLGGSIRVWVSGWLIGQQIISKRVRVNFKSRSVSLIRSCLIDLDMSWVEQWHGWWSDWLNTHEMPEKQAKSVQEPNRLQQDFVGVFDTLVKAYLSMSALRSSLNATN